MNARTTFAATFAACAACAALLAAGPAAAQLRQQAQPQQQSQPQQQPQVAPQPAPGPQVFVAPPSLMPPAEPLPTVALSQVLERAARGSNKQFLMQVGAQQQVFLGGARLDDVNYALLLSILRNNGLAAVTIEGRVNIVPVGEIRSFPLPIVNVDDPKIADDEWVQRVITTTSVETPQLVPILRPMLPVWAHLAAYPPNKLIVVDRYANVKRITETVKALDR